MKLAALTILLGAAILVSAGPAAAQTRRGSPSDQPRSATPGTSPTVLPREEAQGRSDAQQDEPREGTSGVRPNAAPRAGEQARPDERRGETTGIPSGASPAEPSKGTETTKRPQTQREKAAVPQGEGRHKPQADQRCYTWRRRTDGQLFTHCDPVEQRPSKKSPQGQAAGPPRTAPETSEPPARPPRQGR